MKEVTTLKRTLKHGEWSRVNHETFNTFETSTLIKSVEVASVTSSSTLSLSSQSRNGTSSSDSTRVGFLRLDASLSDETRFLDLLLVTEPYNKSSQHKEKKRMNKREWINLEILLKRSSFRCSYWTYHFSRNGARKFGQPTWTMDESEKNGTGKTTFYTEHSGTVDRLLKRCYLVFIKWKNFGLILYWGPERRIP